MKVVGLYTLALDLGGNRPDYDNRAFAGKVVVTAAMDDNGGKESVGLTAGDVWIAHGKWRAIERFKSR